MDRDSLSVPITVAISDDKKVQELMCIEHYLRLNVCRQERFEVECETRNRSCYQSTVK